jgi:hypothetical protein
VSTLGRPATPSVEPPAAPGSSPRDPHPLLLSPAAFAGGWLIVPAAALALWAAIRAFHGPLTRALTARPAPSQMPLAEAARFTRPEPDELALYLLCLAVPPLVAWVLSSVARRLPRLPAWALAGAAMLAQAGTVAAVLRLWWFQNRHVYRYFYVSRFGLGLAAAGAVAAAAWALARRRRGSPLPPFAQTLAATAVAAAYALLRLRSVVFDDASVLTSPTTVSYHLPFTVGEFSAVMNGRTPGVDFFPQYAWLLPYPLAPVFRVAGLTVHTFTVVMAALSLVALMLQYDVLRRLTGRPWVALALFVPFVALGFHPVEISPDGTPATAFSYFAVGPLRYFGPFLVGWLLAWYLSRPAPSRAWLLFTAAGLGALNNLDFGLPALGGVVLALGLVTLAASGARAAALARLVGIAGLGLASALSIFQAAAFLHSGRLVVLSHMTVFQRAFAILGFAMLPMPRWGLHWVVYFTFMLAIGVAVVRLAAVRASSADADPRAVASERLLCGSLVFGGVFGAGALSYYIGRSHPAVLPAVFPAWGAVVVSLAWVALRGGLRELRRAPLRVVPAILAVIALGVLAGEAVPVAWEERELYAEPKEIGAIMARHVIEAPRNAALLAGLAGRGEKLMVAFPAGHLTAELAGVDDVFPFVEAGSCLVVGQLDEVVARMRANGVTRYFGPPAPELQARVVAAGLPVRFFETLEPQGRRPIPGAGAR